MSVLLQFTKEPLVHKVPTSHSSNKLINKEPKMG